MNRSDMEKIEKISVFLAWFGIIIFLVIYYSGIFEKKDKKKNNNNVQKMAKSYAIKNMNNLEDKESIECFYSSNLRRILSFLFMNLLENSKLGRYKLDMIYKNLIKTNNIGEEMVKLSKDESWETLSFYHFPQLIYAIASYTNYKNNPKKFNLKFYLSNLKDNLENNINLNIDSPLDIIKMFKEKECNTFDKEFFVIYYKYIFETYLSFIMTKFSGMNEKITITNTDLVYLMIEYSKDPTLWKIMVDYNFPSLASLWAVCKLREYEFEYGSKIRIFIASIDERQNYNNPESWKLLESNIRELNMKIIL